MTNPPRPMRPPKWLRRTAIAAWLAWLASYALTGYQLFARVIHPHFLPLVRRRASKNRDTPVEP